LGFVFRRPNWTRTSSGFRRRSRLELRLLPPKCCPRLQRRCGSVWPMGHPSSALHEASAGNRGGGPPGCAARGLPGRLGALGAKRRDKFVCRSSLFCTGMASPRGFEPPTSGLGNRCSIQLSYGDTVHVQRLSRLRLSVRCTIGAQIDSVFLAENDVDWESMPMGAAYARCQVRAKTACGRRQFPPTGR
jgi:hypothetical protein